MHWWHLYQWSLTCFCHLPSGSDINILLQTRCWHHRGPLDTNMTERREQYYYNFFFLTDSNPSKERAWIELEGIEAIVKTSSKAKFFIEFYSTCLEGMILHSRQLKIINKSNLWVSSFTAETRRSSENDSQGCDVPGFLKLGWSFKQLPKVHSRLVYHGNVSFSFKVTVVSLLWTFVS